MLVYIRCADGMAFGPLVRIEMKRLSSLFIFMMFAEVNQSLCPLRLSNGAERLLSCFLHSVLAN